MFVKVITDSRADSDMNTAIWRVHCLYKEI